MWQEERERVHNIDMFKLQVEKDKLNEEKEAFQLEKNIHGFTTANEILDLHVENRRNTKKMNLKTQEAQTLPVFRVEVGSSEEEGTRDVAADVGIHNLREHAQERAGTTEIEGAHEKR